MTSLTLEACKELGVKPRDAERSKNFFALGLISWMYTRPVDPTIEWIDQQFADAAAWCATPTSPRSRPGCTSARPPSCSSTLPDPAGQAASPASTATSPATSRSRTGSSPARSRRACRSSTRRTRSRRRPTSCTSCRSTRTSGSARCRPKTRSPPPRSRSAPRSPASSASPPRAVPGVDLKSEALGLAISLELPLVIIDVQRGGPSTGLPTKTEQSDLLLAMYGRHGESPLPIVAALLAEPLLRRRVRGGAHRAEVPHAGDPAHRRLRRQRRPSRGCSPTSTRCPTSRCRSRRSPTTTASSGRTCATPRRSPARGRSPARPGSCTASAASRSRTAPATSTTTPPTTS